MKSSELEAFDDEPVATAAQTACPKDPPPPVSKVLSGYFALKLEGEPPKGKTGPVTVNLVKTASAIVGSRIWLVMETSDLKGGAVTVEILGGEDEAIVAKDTALSVQEGGSARTSLTATVGNWSGDKNISNAAAYTNKAVIELELKPETGEKTTEWRSSIGKTTEKKSVFHLKVTATGGNETEYTTEDDSLASPDKERSIFLNRKDQQFELYACCCEREFTAADLRVICKDKKLFSATNCPLPADSKTYSALVKELNAAMEAHSITTCLRKAHFLAQVMAETGFDTTVEYANGNGYDKSTFEQDYRNYKLYLEHKKDPKSKYQAYNDETVKAGYDAYQNCENRGHTEKGDGTKYKGRGLIQITWKDSYQLYFNSINKSTLINTPQKVGEDLQLACDSAGWFWTSRASLGDLNGFADKDDLLVITLTVNGGIHRESTHYTTRKTNLKSLLEMMNVKEVCQNLPKITKTIGVYKLSTSKVAELNFGKKHKTAITTLDD